MRKALFFLLFCGCLNCCFAQSYRSTSKTVFKDTTGQVIPEKAFWKQYRSGAGEYGIRPDIDTIAKKVTEARLYKLSEDAIKQNMEDDSIRKAEGKRIGKPAPLLDVIDVYGNPFSSQQNAGKVIVLNFWFIGCAPCRKEMPELKTLTEDYKGQDDVVFISVANDSKPKLLKFLQENAFGYAVAETTKSVEKNWAIRSYPTNIVIDKTGKIVYEDTGYGGNIRSLKRAVKKAMSI